MGREAQAGALGKPRCHGLLSVLGASVRVPHSDTRTCLPATHAPMHPSCISEGSTRVPGPHAKGRHLQVLEIGEPGVGLRDRPVGIDVHQIPAQRGGQRTAAAHDAGAPGRRADKLRQARLLLPPHRHPRLFPPAGSQPRAEQTAPWCPLVQAALTAW